MEIKREWLEELIFASGDARRFTQDSPVLPDVWIRYAQLLTRGKAPVLDLLLTPHAGSTAGDLYLAVDQRLGYERRAGGWWSALRADGGYMRRVQARAARYEIKGSRGEEGRDDAPASETEANLAYNQSTVVGAFHLDEVVRVLLPLTQWWRAHACKDRENTGIANIDTRKGREKLEADLDTLVVLGKERRRRARERREQERLYLAGKGPKPPREAPSHRTKEMDRLMDLLWIVKLVGGMLAAARAADPLMATWEKRQERWKRILANEDMLVAHFRCLVLTPRAQKARPPELPDEVPLFMISRNRKANATISFSVQAMKADAARRVFDASCAGLAWAILDSGIDATHPAFRKRGADRKPFPRAFEDENGRPANGTRVDATFDFTEIRTLLSGKSSVLKDKAAETGEKAAKAEAALQAEKAGAKPNQKKLAHLQRQLKCLKDRHDSLDAYSTRVSAAESAKQIKSSLLRGRSIDWTDLRPFLEIEHVEGIYRPAEHEHGTHVAGILASDWRRDDWDPKAEEHTPDTLIGVCPDIRLYDFRVFSDTGEGDEFSVMAALQFLRYLNANRELPLIHGANLSLAIRHDVANYACGRTPVCDEAERVVNAGVVVVAAAGNYGYNRFSTLTESGAPTIYEGYSDISITDPGNADAVITVGSTHRIEPHTYGVSYFSSRGPTGDGRYKPDLVAPGEKIRAPVPNCGAKIKDGTSMAAPHVSGAAALILARYREFIGRPARVKQILTSTATDLGRDRYFQGAGMVDVLRALQSV